MCMCVCMQACVPVYVCIYVCIPACVPVCMHRYLCMYAFVCTYTSFLDTSNTALLLHREEAIDTQNPCMRSTMIYLLECLHFQQKARNARCILRKIRLITCIHTQDHHRFARILSSRE
jgi:hypothetical protein